MRVQRNSSELLHRKKGELGQPKDAACALVIDSPQLGALPSHPVPNSSSCLWWEWLALIPPLAKSDLVSPLSSVLFLLGCTRNPQTPPASLYQQSLTIKTVPKPKHILSPSQPRTADPRADAEQAVHLQLHSHLFHFWVNEVSQVVCIRTAVLTCRWSIHMIQQQTEGQHHHLAVLPI